jgi:cytochrome P450
MTCRILPLQRYGPWWRIHRREFNQAFHVNAVDAYHLIQAESARKLLLELFASPERLFDHIKRYMPSQLFFAHHSFI